MNTKFISWLEQQNYSILKKWDSNDGNYRRTLILYTTKNAWMKKANGKEKKY